jgi:hypothetical protein
MSERDGRGGDPATAYWEEVRLRQERQKKIVALALLAVVLLIAAVAVFWLLPNGPT